MTDTARPTITPIAPGDPETRSADVVADNVARLRELFPEAFREGGVDFDVLRQLVGDAVDDGDEKYGLSWHGKRQARRIALTPSTGTLRPCPEESVDWETTRNLVIEGDNLEVLKLLQKSYAGKVKLIYIDPPYNTGKDFVYRDDYRDNMRNYLAQTGQVDAEGRRVSSNTEASGRFHTDWLNMVYPRLKLARNLLQEDGVICVSIDDNEVANLKLCLDDIFGPENFVALLPTVMNLKGNNDAFAFSDTHEYTVVYAKARSAAVVYPLQLGEEGLDGWLEDEYGLWRRADTLRRTGQDASRVSRPKGWFPVFVTSAGRVYATDDDRPISPDDETIWPATEAGDELSWTWGRQKINDEWFNLLVIEGRSGKTIYKKQRLALGDLPTRKPKSILYKPEYSSSNGTAEVTDLLGSRAFDSPPKPVALLRDLLQVGAGVDDIVLDFFAGTGSLGHATFSQNVSDAGRRRFILVQLPQELTDTVPEQVEALRFCRSNGLPPTIAEITKERLRRASTKLRNVNPRFQGDLGFRVFKLAESNIRAWDPSPDDLAGTLLEHADHLVPGRTEQDVLYELLLKLGLDLAVPIETREISGKAVHSVGAGALVASLAERIGRADVEPLAAGIVAWVGELAPAGGTQLVFRDAAFEDDVAKTNIAAILAQHDLTNVRSL